MKNRIINIILVLSAIGCTILTYLFAKYGYSKYLLWAFINGAIFLGLLHTKY